MKRRYLFPMLLLLAACERPATQDKTTALPQRIVSLTPSITEVLFAIGAGPRVVGVTEFCDYPPAATTRTSIGGALPKTTNIEQIIALKPDLVIAGSRGQEPTVEQLRGLGLRVEFTRTVGLDDAFAAMQHIGEWTGREAQATRLVALNRQIIAAVAAAVTGPEPSVFYQVWSEPLMTTGPDTYLGELIALAGGRNVFADVAAEYPQISFEQVVARNPQVILAARYETMEAAQKLYAGQPGLQQVDAIRHGRVHFFDDGIVSRPGPRMGQALLLMARALYPDADFDRVDALVAELLAAIDT